MSSPSPVLLTTTITLFLCWTSIVQAETLNVPDDYDTIQEAIEEAEDADILLVAAGTYMENIDFLGKAITVESVDGPAQTTIDGSDLTLGEDMGAVVSFVDGEDSDSVLTGFTITGGGGNEIDLVSGGTGNYGGGVFIDGASPTISNNIIQENDAGDCGGGMRINESESLVMNTIIRENTSGAGDGLVVEFSTVDFVDCEIITKEVLARR